MKKIGPLLYGLCLFAWTGPAGAVTINEIQPLMFGEFAVTGMPPQRIVLAPDGTETTPDGGVTRLLPARRGVCRLGGFPPGNAVSVSLASPVTTQLTNPNGITLDIGDFALDAAGGTYTADASGNITLQVSATLTTGSAAHLYNAGPYRGTYTLDLMIEY